MTMMTAHNVDGKKLAPLRMIEIQFFGYRKGARFFLSIVWTWMYGRVGWQ